jgi:RNA polymerase sigma-70 factor (ECF subfamily)
MNEHDWLALRFEENRAHLTAVAYRILGSRIEADDAVQEAWLRLSRADTSDVANLGGWLTTVVARLCLDMLRSRKVKAEDALDGVETDAGEERTSPEDDVLLADSIGVAMLVVLDTLTPAERVDFVLHDLFDLPFDEIAHIVGRSSAAVRQLASRARRRVQGSEATPDADRVRQREVVDAFLAASRGGQFDTLLALLDPDVVLRADRAAVQFGAAAEVRGAAAVAGTFSGRAQVAQAALIDGFVGAVWAPGGRPKVVFDFTIENGRIVEIELLADPKHLERLAPEVLEKL